MHVTPSIPRQSGTRGRWPQTFVALAFAGTSWLAASAQQQPGNNVTMLTPQQFQAMVAAGTLTPVTRDTIEDEREAARVANRINQDIVDDFLRQNPQLKDLDRLVHAKPDLNKHRNNGSSLRQGPNDTFALTMTTATGGLQTVETMGQDEKLAQLAHSILNLSDTGAQIQLYTTLYNQLPQSYCNPVGTAPSVSTPNAALSSCGNLVPPSALQNATLPAVQSALQTLTSQTSAILQHVVGPIFPQPTGCAAEVGASFAPGVNVGDWGDQTQSMGCPGPSSGGIYANFNFVNKNLLSCVRNQGQRGTCHVFAAVSGVEELVARDTGLMVNLNEQDFQEHVKLLWSPKAPVLTNDNGSSYNDLMFAANNNYRFAYENQWDYNPALFEPVGTYINTCEFYPGTEPGCSDSAPEAPEFCAFFRFLGRVCGYAPAALPGHNSPYGATTVSDVWNAKDPNLTFDYMILGLAFNDAVLLGFNVTNDYQGAPGGYIPYSSSDLGTSVGGHMVHVVGFVSNSDLASTIPSAPPGAGGGYFIIKNSWSTCLGDAGYWYMPVSYLLAEAGEVDLVSSIIE